MKKKSVLVTSFLSLGAAGAFAQATPAPAAPEPMVPLTANVNVTTKYKFRGQDQGGSRRLRKPVVAGASRAASTGRCQRLLHRQLELERRLHATPALEMDFYGGYKGEITKDFGFDVGILQYYYPQKDKRRRLRHDRALRRADLDLR